MDANVPPTYARKVFEAIGIEIREWFSEKCRNAWEWCSTGKSLLLQ
jgi:hypothetical protein